MKRPTDKQVTAEIKKLETMKPNVRRTSAFGDNHHDAIDAQVKVLTEGMDEEEIYAEWENEDDYEQNRNIIDAALEATHWRDGEADDDKSPSENWKELCVR